VVEFLAAAMAFVVAAAAESLHGLRVRRIAGLAFGPARRPAAWARGALVMRASACALIAWGLATLLFLEPKAHRSGDGDESRQRHLLLVLDVSPSVRLVDAGPEAAQSRMHRARDVLDSMTDRVGIRQYEITVIATYNGAIPVVERSKDPEVLRNILNDLPMHYAFHKGDTDLLAGLTEAARIARPWNPNSATLLLVSDGDTIPETGMPVMPASIAHTLVIGVGDPHEGSFIDGRHSRQETSMLRQIAIRLRGSYHNGNTQHVTSDLLGAITAGGETSTVDRLTRREYALIACVLGALIVALLPLALQRFGTAWAPGATAIRHRQPRQSEKRELAAGTASVT